MRTIRHWLPFLLVGLPILGVAAFGGGIVITDHLEEDNTFCTACHLHEKKFTEFHPMQGKQVTLAAAHNLEGDKNVKCIDCHIGATVTDKMIIKALAARDTVAYFVGAFQEPTHLRYALGTRTCLKCHPSGGQNPAGFRRTVSREGPTVSIRKGGSLVDFDLEDPRVRQDFKAELASKGLSYRMPGDQAP